MRQKGVIVVEMYFLYRCLCNKVQNERPGAAKPNYGDLADL